MIYCHQDQDAPLCGDHHHFITIKAKDYIFDADDDDDDDINISTDSLNLMSFPAGMSNANFCSTEHQSSTESNDEDDDCDAAPPAGIFGIVK